MIQRKGAIGRVEARRVVRRSSGHSGTGLALLAGIGIFGVGFGVISLLWWFGTWPTDVRRLWTYRSATFGDALLLPVAAQTSIKTRGLVMRRTTRD